MRNVGSVALTAGANRSQGGSKNRERTAISLSTAPSFCQL